MLALFDDVDLERDVNRQIETLGPLAPDEHIAPEVRPSVQPRGEGLDLRQSGQAIPKSIRLVAGRPTRRSIFWQQQKREQLHQP